MLEDDLEMCATTVKYIFGLLTRTQHKGAVLLGSEVWWRDAGCFRPVSTVTEGLTEKGRQRERGSETVRAIVSLISFVNYSTDYNLKHYSHVEDLKIAYRHKSPLLELKRVNIAYILAHQF
jgi:hypothetical protein